MITERRTIEAIFRLLIIFEAQRAGLDPHMVLELRPQDRRSKDIEWARANGCRQMAIYAAHTFFSIPVKQLAPVAKIKFQSVARTVQHVAEIRDNDPSLSTWLDDIEDIIVGTAA